MKNLFINITLALLVVYFAGMSFTQCSRKNKAIEAAQVAQAAQVRAENDYIDLVKSKTRIDTVYKDGQTKTVYRDRIKPVTDTLFIEAGKVYGLFKDSIIDPDLTLRAEVVASDMRSIKYDYRVREKIIREQTILTVHDTLIQQVRRGQLIGLADIGLHSYSAGLQWQSRARLGVTFRYTLYKSDLYPSIGVTYRIF